MALFKQDQEKQAFKDDQRTRLQAQKERNEFQASPPGLAEASYQRGDKVFQYSYDVMNQTAIVTRMVGASVSARSADPSEILNAVCQQGWDLVNGSFVFVETGQQSRDKFLASGQNVSVSGTTVGYYLFRRCEQNRVVEG